MNELKIEGWVFSFLKSICFDFKIKLFWDYFFWRDNILINSWTHWDISKRLLNYCNFQKNVCKKVYYTLRDKYKRVKVLENKIISLFLL